MINNIWIDPSDQFDPLVSWSVIPFGQYQTHFIRHDLHLALVAGVYEDAAAECVFYAKGLVDDNGSYWMRTTLPDQIRALTPTDAQDALKARDKRVREEALRDALQICFEADRLDDAERQILALLKEEQTDE